MCNLSLGTQRTVTSCLAWTKHSWNSPTECGVDGPIKLIEFGDSSFIVCTMLGSMSLRAVRPSELGWFVFPLCSAAGDECVSCMVTAERNSDFCQSSSCLSNNRIFE